MLSKYLNINKTNSYKTIPTEKTSHLEEYFSPVKISIGK